jgi:hypothetical protein
LHQSTCQPVIFFNRIRHLDRGQKTWKRKNNLFLTMKPTKSISLNSVLQSKLNCKLIYLVSQKRPAQSLSISLLNNDEHADKNRSFQQQ